MEVTLPESEREAFQTAFQLLKRAAIPFVVGGAFAMHHYTGIWRYTKDMDLFLLPENVGPALQILADAGYDTRMEAEHWLAKAFRNEALVDLIFGSGNWLAPVDRLWLTRSHQGTILGEEVRVAPVEEMIWSKAYVAVRHRYDGADVVHLIHAVRGNLDWDHLLWRFNDHWELLFSYVSLFRFVYPSDKNFIPIPVMKKFLNLLREDLHKPPPVEKITRGLLLDRFAYTYDVRVEGYIDPREQLAEERGGLASEIEIDRQIAHEESMHRWL